MSRVFFDTMMFVYVLEDHPVFAEQVRSIVDRCQERGDSLLTSCLAVGEVMAGDSSSDGSRRIANAIEKMGFTLVPFNHACMERFAKLRADARLKAPDAIHLACAGAAQTDLFLTNDQQLLQRRLFVPGIQFIGDFAQPWL